MKNVLVLILTLLSFAYGQAARSAQEKTPVLRSVFKPLSKKSNHIEIIRLYQDKSFEHLVYTPDHDFKGGIDDAVYYKVLKNTGKYSLESGKMKLNCLEKNFPCKLYDVTLYVDNSKVYDNRFRAIFKKKEYVLRSAPKEKYSQPYFMDPESGRVVTNENLESEVDIKALVSHVIKGETEGRSKIKIWWRISVKMYSFWLKKQSKLPNIFHFWLEIAEVQEAKELPNYSPKCSSSQA